MIYHLATRLDWERRTPIRYAPSGLSDEGFVHCSAGEQVLDTAHAHFGDRHDLLILTIDETRLGSPVVWEDLYGSSRDFPHIYGPVDLDAVVSVRPFPPDEEGLFDWWNADDPPVAHCAGPQSSAIQDLLSHFGQVGFDGAPRPLGIARGLELATHIDGITVTLPYPEWLGAQALSSLGALIRRAHDASEGFATSHAWVVGQRVIEDGDVVVHRDIGPGNVVWTGGRATGLIDWELAEPGPRLFDLGIAAVSFGGLVPPDRAVRSGIDPGAIDDRVRALAVGYGDVAPAAIRSAASSALEEKLARLRSWGAEGRCPWAGFVAAGVDDRIEQTLEWLAGSSR